MLLCFLNNHLKCTVSVLSYSLFEAQCVALQSASSALFCALIYRPPNLDFSQFLTSVVPFYDCTLLVGDFIVHVCEFCNVLDSMYESINTYPYGDNVYIENSSDHQSILFMIPVVSSVIVDKPVVDSYSHYVNSLTASQFREKYLANAVEISLLNAKSSFRPDDLISISFLFLHRFF